MLSAGLLAFVLPTFNSEPFLTVKFDEEKKRKKECKKQEGEEEDMKLASCYTSTSLSALH